MKKIISSLLLYLIFATNVASAKADYSKLSSFMRMVLSEMKTGRMEKIIKAHDARGNRPGICAFVRISNRADSILEANDCRRLARFGDIYIADIPLNRIEALSNDKYVTRIESGRGTQTCNDSVAIQIGADAVYAGKGLPQAFTGRGVVMGIQDVGFDLTHPNFYNRDKNEYRIKRLWDQLAYTERGNSMYVGAEYTTEEDLRDAGCTADGTKETHGTLTLGVAAGGGAGTKYRGIAYESDICLVSNAVGSNIEFIKEEDLYKYTYATDALGFKYIFDYAEQMGQPCVISFSEGSLQDFRGDDMLYYEVLKSLTGPGRIIVSAAGNTGNYKNYIHKTAGRDGAGTFVMLYADKPLTLTAKSAQKFDLRFVTYDAERDTLDISTADVLASTDSTLTVTKTMSGSEYKVNIDAYRSCYDDAETVYDIYVTGPLHIGMITPLSVEIRGKEADVELYRGNCEMRSNPINPALADGDVSHGINSPSSAPAVICVGATSYRSRFVNHAGELIINDYGSNGRRADYSSVGPTYDGRTKPEVMAPGTNIITSTSSYYIENNPGDLQLITSTFQDDGRTYGWMGATGTSMSSPVVGGTIALWLQARPDLTPDDVLRLMSRTCTPMTNASGTADNMCGYGQIDAYRGLLDLLGLSGIDTIEKHQPQCVTFGVNSGRLRLMFARDPQQPVTMTIYNMEGAALRHFNIDVSGNKYDTDLTWLPRGIYLVQLNSRYREFTGSTLIRL
ncbi:MAG: S8 family serine peptidase [Prevotella sp.]